MSLSRILLFPFSFRLDALLIDLITKELEVNISVRYCQKLYMNLFILNIYRYRWVNRTEQYEKSFEHIIRWKYVLSIFLASWKVYNVHRAIILNRLPPIRQPCNNLKSFLFPLYVNVDLLTVFSFFFIFLAYATYWCFTK